MSGSDKKISDEDSIAIAKFIGFIFFFYIISQNFTLFFIFLIFSFLLYIFYMILKMFGLL
jgi:hypothetical protein